MPTSNTSALAKLTPEERKKVINLASEAGPEQVPARDSESAESRGSEGSGGDDRPDFGLKQQTESDLKAKADEEAAQHKAERRKNALEDNEIIVCQEPSLVSRYDASIPLFQPPEPP